MSWKTSIIRGFILGLMCWALVSCSLLDLSIENPATPLTDQQMNTRILTRDFLAEYFKVIEDSSDHALSIDNRVDHQLSLAYWRISSEKAAVKAVMQTDPTLALLDLWN